MNITLCDCCFEQSKAETLHVYTYHSHLDDLNADEHGFSNKQKSLFLCRRCYNDIVGLSVNRFHDIKNNKAKERFEEFLASNRRQTNEY